jgi:hypothetical protein
MKQGRNCGNGTTFFVDILSGAHSMADPGNSNQGEGNREADRHYREATEKFVNSPRGRAEIEQAGNLSAEQQREIEQAEREAKSRAKEHDPAERRNPGKAS